MVLVLVDHLFLEVLLDLVLYQWVLIDVGRISNKLFLLYLVTILEGVVKLERLDTLGLSVMSIDLFVVLTQVIVLVGAVKIVTLVSR